MRHPKSIVQWFNPNFSWWNHIHCPISDFGWRLIGVHQQGELQPQVRGLAQVWAINALDPSFFRNGSDHFESDFPQKKYVGSIISHGSSCFLRFPMKTHGPWRPGRTPPPRATRQRPRRMLDRCVGPSPATPRVSMEVSAIDKWWFHGDRNQYTWNLSVEMHPVK